MSAKCQKQTLRRPALPERRHRRKRQALAVNKNADGQCRKNKHD